MPRPVALDHYAAATPGTDAIGGTLWPMSGQQGMPMVRFVPIALLLTLCTAPAAGQAVGNGGSWRVRDVTIQTAERHLPSIEAGAHGRFGLGMFGLKNDTPRSRAVIGHEVSAPKQRRVGLGFSMKF